MYYFKLKSVKIFQSSFVLLFIYGMYGYPTLPKFLTKYEKKTD